MQIRFIVLIIHDQRTKHLPVRNSNKRNNFHNKIDRPLDGMALFPGFHAGISEHASPRTSSDRSDLRSAAFYKR